MKAKSAIITGASKGIGRAVAKHLATMGYDLLLLSRSEDLLHELRDEIIAGNSQAKIEISALDVFDHEKLEATIKAYVEKNGAIDLLFNNAGYVKRGTSQIENFELDKMLNMNLIGAVNVIKATLPYMLALNSGYIVNVCSRSAEIPRPLLGGYAASKAALLAYSESLYKELKDTKIKVTALCPGFVDTEMTMDVKEDRSKLINTSDICKTIDYLMGLSESVAIKKISFESAVQIGGYG